MDRVTNKHLERADHLDADFHQPPKKPCFLPIELGMVRITNQFPVVPETDPRVFAALLQPGKGELVLEGYFIHHRQR